MKSLCVIPARYDSQRLPAKPLIKLLDKSLIHTVYERVDNMNLFDRVVVATDDERIVNHLEELSIPYIITDRGHPSGTDRCAEVSRSLPDYGIVVNVQGDEPLVEKELLTNILISLQERRAQIVTGVSPIDSELDNPNIVKVVVNKRNEALYFSRSKIPFQRDEGVAYHYLRHIGVYGFTKDSLAHVSSLSPTTLENIEKLEQLRWLHDGLSIHCIEGDWKGLGIDTMEDVLAYRQQFLG